MPRDILIDPQRTGSGNPNIQFSGSAGNTILLEVLSEGSVQFTGVSGSLLRISDFPAAGGSLNSLFLSGTVAITGSFIPGESNGFDLGSSTKKWANIYSTNIIGSLTGSNLTAGQVVVAGTGGVLSGSNNLFWNNTDGYLGVGTSSPIGRLSVGNGNQSVVVDSTGTGGVGSIQSYNGALRINNGGNNTILNTDGGVVGIGTTSPPASKFFVSGSVTLSDPVVIIKAGVSSPTGGASVLDVQNSAGTSLLFVSGSGAVGIGTTVSQLPSHKLHVSGKIGGGLYVDSSLEFLATGNTELKANSDLKLGYALSTVIRSTGNVGIGTATPSSRLHVYGSSTSTTSTAIIQEGTTPTGGAAALNVQNVAGATLFFVSGSGRVGIASSSPNARLEINLGGSNAEILALKTTYAADNSYHSMTWRDGSNITGQIDTRYDGTNVDMVFGSLYSGGYNSTERMRIKGSGNVGIGTSLIDTRFVVNGNTVLSGTLNPAADNTHAAGTTLKRWANVVSNAFSGSLTMLSDGTTPYLQAGTNVTITTGSNGAVTIAASLAGGTLSGAGTTNYIPKYTASTTLGNSNIFDNGTNVGIGTTLIDTRLVVNGNSVFSGSVNPDSDITKDLGSSTKRWNNIYAANISGSLTGSNVTAGQVVVAGAGGVLSGSNDFYWNNSNKRVGIGTNAPALGLEVRGAPGSPTTSGTTQNYGSLRLRTNTVNSQTLDFGIFNTGNYGAWIQATNSGDLSSNSPLALNPNGGGVGIGTTSAAGTTLLVSGSTIASDTTAYIRAGVPAPTSGAGVLNVQNSAGTSLFFVSGSGRVGIATTPSATITNAKLEVNGSVVPTTHLGSGNNIGESTNYWGTSYLNYGYFYNGSTNSIAINAGTFQVYSQTSPTSYSIYADANNRVGIGAIANSSVRLFVSGTSTITDTTLLVKHGTANGSALAVINAQNSSGTSLLFLSGSGAVGIGTSTLVASGLTVSDVANINNAARLNLRQDNSDVGNRLATVSFNSNAVSIYTAAESTGIANNTLAYFHYNYSIFYTGTTATNPSERLRIDSGGNVGIGTTNPNGNRLAISGGNLSVTGSVLPGVDNSYDLGSSSPQYRWRTIHAVNISGSITPTGATAGSVFFAGASGQIAQDNSNFFWDDTNNRLGVGTNTTTSGRSITSAADVEFYGVRVGRGGGDGSTNTVVGNGTMTVSATAAEVTAIGSESLSILTSGAGNTAVGRRTMYVQQTGGNCTAVGNNVLAAVTTADHTAVGAAACVTLSTGTGVTALGRNAGRYINSGAALTVATDSVLIGRDTRVLADSGTNEIVIGAAGRGNGSNTTTIGNSSTVLTYLAGNVGIGTTNTNGNAIAVSGQASITGSILPGADNTYDLGSSSYRWKQVNMVSGSMVSGSISSLTHTPISTGGSYTRNYLAGESGRLTATKSIAAATNTTFFTITANNGATLVDVSFVVSESGFSVSRKYTVASQYGNTSANVVSFKTVDTGPYGGYDLTVTFTKSSHAVTTCTVSHNYTTTTNIAMTLDVSAVSSGGSPTTVTIF